MPDFFERFRRDDQPLAEKATTLVSLGLAVGLCIGIVEAALGSRLWPAGLLTLIALAALRPLSRAWIADPFARLLHLLPGLDPDAHPDQPRRPVSDLPTHRTDEVGQLAGHVRDVLAHRIATHHESRQLRRTLDQRVQHATRRATADLQKQAQRDPLTGAGNRRFLDDQLPGLIEASQQSQTELIAIAIDMDHFKAVNDTLGHAEGDALLTLLTDLLTGLNRGDDLIVRLGGDEFLVLQPGGQLDKAEQLATRLRRLYLQQTRRMLDALDGTQPNLSIGVAGLMADALPSGAALLERADQRIYEAKHAGRGVTALPWGIAA
ncbi:MAG: GGDEF domain-containing protein [Planctomycetota bacterium]